MHICACVHGVASQIGVDAPGDAIETTAYKHHRQLPANMFEPISVWTQLFGEPTQTDQPTCVAVVVDEKKE